MAKIPFRAWSPADSQNEASGKGAEGERMGQSIASLFARNTPRATSRSSTCCRPASPKAGLLNVSPMRLGISRAETMAIGDNWNDVAMFEWAGQAVVMANAAQDLRTMAKTLGWKQAPSNDDHGVAVIFEKALKHASAARQ